MKSLVIILTLAVFSFSFAWDSWGSKRGYSKPYKDYWGNSYKSYDNMWRDDDGDGVSNYYDYNDRNPNIQYPYQRGYKRRKWGW
ncbi:hypothetical protein [Persephonella sp.]|uniref:hypothetical protein n=1 Tax=Persephonella sp. TaxID=2060922 RepID=UPI0026046BEF|nr:hypothetical protein [Persephonella sp.]